MNSKLKIGYLLYRTKGLVEHAGVYLGNNTVLHNSPTGDVEIVEYEEYAQGKEVKVIITDNTNLALLKVRLSDIFQQDHSYSAASNNCEHIANFLVQGRKYSPQLRAAVISGAIMGLLSCKSGKGNPLLMACLGAAGGTLLSNSLRKYDQKIPAIAHT